MKCLERFHLILLLSLLACGAQASAIESLRAFVKDTRTMRATFVQTVLDRDARVMQRSDGVMQFERPGKFRWAYEKPYEQLIVGDGARVWFYDRDLDQVTVRRLDQAIGASPAALLAGSGDIESGFDLAELGARGDMEWLEARPGVREGTFEWVRLGFSSTGEFKAMELRDHFGQTTVLVFSRVERNPRLAPELFIFNPPAGADVISD